MTIKFYKTTDENNKLNKTLTDELTMNCIIKETSSITKPFIRVAYSPDILQMNYVYIQEFNRYYFITDMTIEFNNVFLLELKVDPLMSFKNCINNLTILTERYENGNNYIADGDVLIDVRNIIETQNFNSPFSKNLNYVLCVAGGPIITT